MVSSMRRVAAISAGARSASPRGRRGLSLFDLSFTGRLRAAARGSNRCHGERQARPKPLVDQRNPPRRTAAFHQSLSIPLPGTHILRRRRTVAKAWGISMHFSLRGILAAAIALAALAAPAFAEEGVTADTITFGQAAVLEGPASALGLGMQQGLNAAFNEVNAKGGVHGRKIKLISVNDGYEPDRAVAATKKLIEEDKVFALIGPVGTPTSAAAQPIATAAKVPFMGAFTGAGFLRNPKFENVINVRASYDAETEAWVKHLTEDLKVSKIAIFYQDDAFGRAGLSGFKKAMDKRNMAIAAEATYERNTVAVKTGVLALKQAAPEAVGIVGAFQPGAEL